MSNAGRADVREGCRHGVTPVCSECYSEVVSAEMNEAKNETKNCYNFHPPIGVRHLKVIHDTDLLIAVQQ